MYSEAFLRLALRVTGVLVLSADSIEQPGSIGSRGGGEGGWKKMVIPRATLVRKHNHLQWDPPCGALQGRCQRAAVRRPHDQTRRDPHVQALPQRAPELGPGAGGTVGLIGPGRQAQFCVKVGTVLDAALAAVQGLEHRGPSGLTALDFERAWREMASDPPPPISYPPPPRVQRTLCPTNTTRSNHIFCVPN